MDEFELIRHYFSRHGQQGDVLLSVGDDAAVWRASPDARLVMTMDTVLSGRHFPEDLPAFDIGYRALAVNLSDLAAMGAIPRLFLLSVALPEVNTTWLDEFSRGLYQLADQFNVHLVGGDTVKGSLSVTIQATGVLPSGARHDTRLLTRGGACPGDRICIGGIPGEAAAGLALWQQGVRSGELVARFCRPEPQVALGQKLFGVATACIDVSDGLLADLNHLLVASGNLGAELELDALPCSDALAAMPDRYALQLAGGDDYLLLFTLPSTINLPKGCTQIGRVSSQSGVRLLGEQSEALAGLSGWNHFKES